MLYIYVSFVEDGNSQCSCEISLYFCGKWVAFKKMGPYFDGVFGWRAGNQLCTARESASYYWTMSVYILTFDVVDQWNGIKSTFSLSYSFHADSSFVPPLIYSLLGSSRHLAVGPVSIASLVMGTMLSEKVSPVQHPALYLKLAFTATFFAGLFQASLGFLRYLIFNYSSESTWMKLNMVCGMLMDLQIRVCDRFSVKGNPCWIHGWCCNHCVITAAEGIAGNRSFHYQNAIDSRFDLCIWP